ncbi:MAG TPA: hypothetical protein VHM29_05975 [Acidimicrobiia bacterium]|nr:hypothetical protein [Acidimicrobiia bacterium]
MSRFSIPAVTGLAVFIAGLIALHVSTTPVVSASDSVIPASVPGPAAIEDLDPSVQRVLQDDGWARVLTADELAAIPATVARTLIEHGAALVLPSDRNR